MTNPTPRTRPDRTSALNPDDKAEVLVQALPWLERFAGAVVVIKFGGNAMIDADLERAFAQDVRFFRYAGLKPVVVHGGGPQISSMLQRLQITPEFRGGLRVTTPETMDVVRMVLTGQVQRTLVSALNTDDPLAVGLSGEDAGLFRARRRQAMENGTSIDIGMVGDVVEVDPRAVQDLLGAGRIPVVASVAPDEHGQVPGADLSDEQRVTSRENVAEVITHVVRTGAGIGRTYNFVDGTTPIEQAII